MALSRVGRSVLPAGAARAKLLLGASCRGERRAWMVGTDAPHSAWLKSDRSYGAGYAAGTGSGSRQNGGYQVCGRRLLAFSAMGAALATVSGRRHAGAAGTSSRTHLKAGLGISKGGSGAYAQGGRQTDSASVGTRMCAC